MNSRKAQHYEVSIVEVKATGSVGQIFWRWEGKSQEICVYRQVQEYYKGVGNPNKAQGLCRATAGGLRVPSWLEFTEDGT